MKFKYISDCRDRNWGYIVEMERSMWGSSSRSNHDSVFMSDFSYDHLYRIAAPKWRAPVYKIRRDPPLYVSNFYTKKGSMFWTLTFGKSGWSPWLGIRDEFAVQYLNLVLSQKCFMFWIHTFEKTCLESGFRSLWWIYGYVLKFFIKQKPTKL